MGRDRSDRRGRRRARRAPTAPSPWTSTSSSATSTARSSRRTGWSTSTRCGTASSRGWTSRRAARTARRVARSDARPRRRSPRVHAPVRPRAERRAGRRGRGRHARDERLPVRRGAASADGYRLDERFYRRTAGAPGGTLRRLTRLAAHVPDMLAYRRAAAAADVVHLQWLAVGQVDERLLPRRPLVLTAHDVLPREPRPGQVAAQARLLGRMDAVVVLSEHGRRAPRRRGRRRPGPRRGHPARRARPPHARRSRSAPGRPGRGARSPSSCASGSCARTRASTCSCEAWEGIADAELWIVGRPRMDTAALHAAAPPGVRFVERFVDGGEAAAFFRRADLAVLPYREIEGSGVLATALAFGLPLLLTDVGSSPRSPRPAPRARAARRPGALHGALAGLVGDADATPGARGGVGGRGSRPVRVGADRRASPRALRQAGGLMRAIVLACAALLAYAQVGYGLLLTALARVLRLPAPVADPRPGAPLPRVALIVAAHDEAARHRVEAAQRARPRLPARPARDRRRQRRVDRRHRRARAGRPAPTSCSTSRAAARSAPRTPAVDEVAGRADLLAFGDANALWERDALRRLAAAFEDPQVGVRLRAGGVRQQFGHEPGGPLLALRDGAARAGVRAARRHRRQRRDLRGAARGLPARRRRHGPRPRLPVRDRQARQPGGVRPRGARDREDGPVDRGRVGPQAPHDEPRVADRPAAAGCSTRAAIRRATRS